jgi:hypothetical protein
VKESDNGFPVGRRGYDRPAVKMAAEGTSYRLGNTNGRHGNSGQGEGIQDIPITVLQFSANAMYVTVSSPVGPPL